MINEGLKYMPILVGSLESLFIGADCRQVHRYCVENTQATEEYKDITRKEDRSLAGYLRSIFIHAQAVRLCANYAMQTPLKQPSCLRLSYCMA